jgi:5-methylcytosine-specific restriction endonuclease McrA
MRGKPLMPTTPRKAKVLLKEGKATVKERCPFIIQLKYATGETTQPIRLGLDIGYQQIGFSAMTDTLGLICGTLILRKDVSKKLEERRIYRRSRRGRLWYRESRFLNRKKEEGWLAPSIQHRFDSHIRLVTKLESLLPITYKKVEVANFDAHKMQNSEINGIEYQHGTLQGYKVREYLLDKYQRTCIYCGKKNVPLEVEHIVPKSRGGTDSVTNLTLSCKDCNKKKGDKTAEEFGYPNVQKQATIPLKAAACLNNLRWKIIEHLEAEYTYGYVTKYQRKKLGLEKSHINDAFVIADGTNQERCGPYEIIQVRRRNRSLQKNRKGFKPSIKRQNYQLQPYDLVKYNMKIHRVKGSHCYGKRVVLENPKGKNPSVAISKIELVKYGKGFLFAFCK